VTKSSLRAAYIIDRWRRQGFDTLTCYPSGYCAPANSIASTSALPEGYCRWPIDSPEALDSLRVSIDSGVPYRM